MRFSEIFTASILASVTAAHGGIPGAPKIVGNVADIAALRSRNILGSRRVAHPHDSNLQARQGGDVNGRCGKDFGCATCAEGYCCSSGGWCGKGSDYCQAPDSQFEYGPAGDANTVPPGGSTLNTLRPKDGTVLYGGEGIYVCTKPGKIAITYDDGPYSYTGKVLDLFQSYGFKATFFITGINLSKGRVDDTTTAWPALIQRMLAEGHQIASHTWSHQDLSAITKQQRYDQIVRLEMALTNIIGKFPTYMRPPYSSCSDASGCPQDMADLGYHISYFDLDTDDYNNITPELQQNAKNNFYNAVNPSNSATDEFLAIGHDIHYQTAYNLTGYMLDLMQKKGYTGVTMGECLGDPEANWYRTPAARVASTSSFSQPACASTASRSSSASSTSTGVFATPTVTSPDSSCGGTSGYTCLGFSGGECCSPYNYCGNTAGHCGDGCQAGFGKCGIFSSSASSSGASATSAVSASTGVSSTLVSSTRASTSASTSAVPSRTPSTDATCAGVNGYGCIGSAFGDCCSQYGWCGSSTAHCGTGCNPLYGRCGDLSSSSSSVASSSAASSSTSSSVRPSSSSAASTSSSVRPSSSSAASSSASSSVRPSSSSVAQSSSTRISSSATSTIASSTKVSSSSAASSSASTTKISSSSVVSSTKISSSAAQSSSSVVRSSSSSMASSSVRSSSAASSSVRPSSSAAPSSSRPATSSATPSSTRPASSPIASSSSRPASSSSSSIRPSSSAAPTSTKASSSSIVVSSTRVSSATPSSTVKVSLDGSCGGSKGYSCLGYYEEGVLSECCSQYGYCGASTSYCKTGCNKAFGKCT